MAQVTDAKGVPVQVDSLIEGLIGFHTDRKAIGRVFAVSPWGWVAFYDVDNQQQHVSYAGKFLVRGEPRPPKKRGDVPERLR